MKKKLLICSIFRNRENFVNRWFLQILDFMKNCELYEYDISIYENDSSDNTKNIINSLDFTPFNNHYKKFETLNTKYFGSVVDEERVKLLAQARNKCIYADNIDISYYDNILFIEPDFLYDTDNANKILFSEQIHNIKFDVISGISYSGNIFYDSWGTRNTDNQIWGVAQKSNNLTPYWTTFNGFCLYNAEPFKKNISFDWFNYRLNNFDCDTAVVCENFRKNGYNKIFVDCSAEFFHER